VLWKDPLGVGLACPAQDPTEYRDDADMAPHTITPSGPALRVGMELKLVMFSAERTSPAGNGDSNESDEVLKRFDGKGTLPCPDLWRGYSKPSKACGCPRSFSTAP
jgi:hypothetical protein